MLLKRVFLLVLVVTSLCLPAGRPVVASPPAQHSAQKQECTVYVTRTGHRYHQGWCRYLRQSKIRMTRTNAIKAGYTPCRVCGGSDCEQR